MSNLCINSKLIQLIRLTRHTTKFLFIERNYKIPINELLLLLFREKIMLIRYKVI